MISTENKCYQLYLQHLPFLYFHNIPQNQKLYLLFWLNVVYFDQLSGATRTGKLVINLLFCLFSTFQCFFLISDEKSSKMFEINKKRLKTAKKSVSTRFWLCPALKSWLKYTTAKLDLDYH